MSDLARFHSAQEGVFDRALEELRKGRKTSHWMWFIFPQLSGLGRSSTAEYYAISGLSEARAYLADPVLSSRLTEAARAILSHPDKTAEAILGPVDALKLRSSTTLFEAAGGGPEFSKVLEIFYSNQRCSRTLELIGT